MAETPPSDDDASPFSTEQVDEIVSNRAAIEQAKGSPRAVRTLS
jgi:hypothetical protein